MAMAMPTGHVHGHAYGPWAWPCLRTMAMAMPRDPRPSPKLCRREREREIGWPAFVFNKALLPDTMSHWPWPQVDRPMLMGASQTAETIKTIICFTHWNVSPKNHRHIPNTNQSNSMEISEHQSKVQTLKEHYRKYKDDRKCTYITWNLEIYGNPRNLWKLWKPQQI